MKMSTQMFTALIVGALALLMAPADASSLSPLSSSHKRSKTKSILGGGDPKLHPFSRLLESAISRAGEPPEDEFPEEPNGGEDEDGEEGGTSAPDPVPPPPEGEVPANDRCLDAIPLAAGDSVMGSNVFATEENVPACNDFLGGNVSGIWYTVEGTGQGLGGEINATYDMQVAVYAGSCDQLVCVDGTAGEAFPWQSGEIKGASQEGDTYYVIVAGWEGAVGDFELEIFDGEIPANSECADAPMITLGETVTGTTEYASTPADEEFPPCTIDEIFFGITSPTVWYTFMGTGSIVQFSLFADYDAQISIYEGDECGNLTCWNSNDDSPIEGPQSLIVQPLDEGKLYYINVHGYEREYGDFTIESEELEAAPNDECENAIPMEVGEEVRSDTLAATGDPDLPFCGIGSNASSPGIWYSLMGTGNTMQVRLNGTLSLHFSIYTGGCDALECAGSNFFGFYPFTWDTTEGEEYLIYVYGREHALTDTFDIIAEEVERPPNDDCTDAIPLEINEVQSGTTRASSTEEGLEFCGDVLGIEEFFGGVWYSFEGTGDTRLVGVSAGSNGTGFFDTVVSVYTGSCEDLTCLDGNDQGLTYQEYENAVLLDTVEGETYYVFVHGYGLSRGDFEIGLLGIPRPSNDDCASAEVLELGDTVQGNTEFAEMADDWAFESCGTSQGGNFSAPGIWYSVVGGGFPVQASIFGQYDIQMTVFTGTCDALECVDGTEGNQNDFFNGLVIWDAEDGVDYYILVHGFTGATGEFEMFYETAITRQ